MFRTILLCILMLLAAAGPAIANEAAVFDRKMAAARQGDPEAQYDVAYRYEKGRGVDEDEEEALAWYRKAADQDLAKAQYKLGMCYLKGKGTDPDRQQAREWLRKAAEKGYPPAQYHLGKLFTTRPGRNYRMALEWLEKAQDAGYEPATRAINKVRRKLN